MERRRDKIYGRRLGGMSLVRRMLTLFVQVSRKQPATPPLVWSWAPPAVRFARPRVSTGEICVFVASGLVSLRPSCSVRSRLVKCHRIPKLELPPGCLASSNHVQLSHALLSSRNESTGGESGIRTHVTLSSKHAFQACAFSHSAISPAPCEVILLILTVLRTAANCGSLPFDFAQGRDDN